MSTEELPIWTVVRDVSDDGSPLVIVVRAADSHEAIAASISDEVAAALVASGDFPHRDDDQEPGDWRDGEALADASYHVVTIAGDLSAAVESHTAVVLNMVTGEVLA